MSNSCKGNEPGCKDGSLWCRDPRCFPYCSTECYNNENPLSIISVILVVVSIIFCIVLFLLCYSIGMSSSTNNASMLYGSGLNVT